MFIYQKSLTEAGLSEVQAVIYEVLLKLGPQNARSIHARSPFKRGLIYKALDQLVEQGLVEKIEPPKKVAIFKAKHPARIKDLAENRLQVTKNSLWAIDQVINQLSSDFNLATGQPGVKFFEGEAGLRQVWWDTLNSQTPVYTYGDLEAIVKKYTDLNKQYVIERKKRKIKKLAIANDSEFNRKFLADYDREQTETRLISSDQLKFESTVVQIYDGRVSYTTLNTNSLIGVIITDPNIYELNKRMFEKMWRDLVELKLLTPPKIDW